jgi:hypothetical protein
MEHKELFASKDEAFVFIKGFEAAIETMDDDHGFINEPEQLHTGEWVVTYGLGC